MVVVMKVMKNDRASISPVYWAGGEGWVGEGGGVEYFGGGDGDDDDDDGGRL